MLDSRHAEVGRRRFLRMAALGVGALGIPLLGADTASAHGLACRLFHRRARCRPAPAVARMIVNPPCNQPHYLCASQPAGTGSDPTGVVVYYYLGVHCCDASTITAAMTSTSPRTLTQCSASLAMQRLYCDRVGPIRCPRETHNGLSQSECPSHFFAKDKAHGVSSGDIGLPRKAQVDFAVTLPGDINLPPENYYDVTIGMRKFRVKAFSYLYANNNKSTYFDVGVQVDETTMPPSAPVAVVGQAEGKKALSFANSYGRTCYVLTADDAS